MKARFLKAAFSPKEFPPPLDPEVVFVGRSNVGKSTLINTILNNKRLAKTSATPGKTQSINFYQVDKILFVDLPGYGYAQVPWEVRRSWDRLIRSYFESRKNIALILLLLDIRRDFDEDAKRLIDWFKELGIRTCAILTKTDKVSKSKALLKKKEIGDQVSHMCCPPILFSSKTGIGKEEIWGVIGEAIQRFNENRKDNRVLNE